MSEERNRFSVLRMRRFFFSEYFSQLTGTVERYISTRSFGPRPRHPFDDFSRRILTLIAVSRLSCKRRSPEGVASYFTPRGAERDSKVRYAYRTHARGEDGLLIKTARWKHLILPGCALPGQLGTGCTPYARRIISAPASRMRCIMWPWCKVFGERAVLQDQGLSLREEHREVIPETRTVR